MVIRSYNVIKLIIKKSEIILTGNYFNRLNQSGYFMVCFDA